MSIRSRAGMVVCGVVGMVLWSSAYSETITLRSGTGTIGGSDSNITYMSSGDGAIGPFSASDFEAASSGAHATVSQALTGLYVYPLPHDTAAQWIAVGGIYSARSALYAYSFQVETSQIGTASIDLYYAADNYLGEPTVPGLYINGQPVSGSSGVGDLTVESHLSSDQIGPLLHPGTNTLYFYQYDTGGLSGSIFSATISIASASPGAVAILVQPKFHRLSVNLNLDTVSVAVLGTATFDVTTVDPASVRFGPNGAATISSDASISDVNGDGYPDMTLSFNTADTGLVVGPSVVTLSATTKSGITFSSAEAITARVRN